MSAHEITEADVVAWLTARAKEHSEEFGGYGYAQAEVLLYTHADIAPKATFHVGADGLCLQYSGQSLADAREIARKESKPDIAAKKRANAARLLAEAEALEGKR